MPKTDAAFVFTTTHSAISGAGSRTGGWDSALLLMGRSVERCKLTAKELEDVAKAIKEVGNQLSHVPKAISGKAKKSRKK